MQLKVDNEADLISSIFQVEYLNATDSKLKQMCANECLKKLDTDELIPVERNCLQQCSEKLSIYYSTFYAQQATIQKEIAQTSTPRQLSSANQA